MQGGIDQLPERTGFMDLAHFATHSALLRADGSREPLPKPFGKPGIVDCVGSRKGYEREVLKIAERSSFLVMAIGVGLAAPIPSYFKLHGREAGAAPIVSETAVFNLSGVSSSGKSTAAKVSLSVSSSPERAGTFDFTPRGLSEFAANSNDLVAVIDDVEHAKISEQQLFTNIATVCQKIPGGASKMISTQSSYANLEWSTFAISSSPASIFDMAKTCGEELTLGQMVRLFNIPVLKPDSGGIFDRLKANRGSKASQSVKLSGRLDSGLIQHHGQLMPRWITPLMRKDRTEEIERLVLQFIKKEEIRAEGWERRFAQKFGLLYAVLRLGIDLGILPWPRSLPLQAIRKCYRLAREGIKSEEQQDHDALRMLKELLSGDKKIAEARVDGKEAPMKIKQATVAVRYKKKGKTKIGLLEDRLAVFMPSQRARKVFRRRLLSLGILDRGHGGKATAQERVAIRRGGKVIKKPRFIVIDEKSYEQAWRRLPVAQE